MLQQACYELRSWLDQGGEPLRMSEDCTAGPHDGALCRAAIALGLALGLEVVAEGVETQEQRQFLTQEHCSTVQGYLVAPPMPADEAFMLLASLMDVPRLRSSLAQA